jgi:hypothetical protein
LTCCGTGHTIRAGYGSAADTGCLGHLKVAATGVEHLGGNCVDMGREV